MSNLKNTESLFFEKQLKRKDQKELKGKADPLCQLCLTVLLPFLGQLITWYYFGISPHFLHLLLQLHLPVKWPYQTQLNYRTQRGTSLFTPGQSSYFLSFYELFIICFSFIWPFVEGLCYCDYFLLICVKLIIS